MCKCPICGCSYTCDTLEYINAGNGEPFECYTCQSLIRLKRLYDPNYETHFGTLVSAE